MKKCIWKQQWSFYAKIIYPLKISKCDSNVYDTLKNLLNVNNLSVTRKCRIPWKSVSENNNGVSTLKPSTPIFLPSHSRCDQILNIDDNLVFLCYTLTLMQKFHNKILFWYNHSHFHLGTLSNYLESHRDFTMIPSKHLMKLLKNLFVYEFI